VRLPERVVPDLLDQRLEHRLKSGVVMRKNPTEVGTLSTTLSLVLTVAIASRSNPRFVPDLNPEQKTGSASGLLHRRL
jgi:hypothetical protein